MKRYRTGRFAPNVAVPPLLAKPAKNAAAVALGKLAAERAREKRAAWVAAHCKRIRETMQ